MAEQELSRQQIVQVAEQLQEQLQALEQQSQQIGEYLTELQQTKDAIATIAEAEEDEKILLPLGSGAFVHARLADADAVLAPLGGGVLAEEPPEKATERLENREKEARQAQQEVGDNIERLEDQLEDLVRSLQGQQAQGSPQSSAPDEQPQGPGQAG